MTRHSPAVRAATRRWATVTATVGAVALLFPRPVARLVSGRGAAPDPRLVRILGARQLVQGGAVLIHPAPGLVAVGCGIDVAHGASMVLAAGIWPNHRTAALISGAVAGTSAAAAAVILGGRRR